MNDGEGQVWEKRMAIYRVAGYAKLAKYWERDREQARAFHQTYFSERYSNDKDYHLTGVFVDITGKKEIRKRPEMVRLLKNCLAGQIDVIDMQTKAYLAANTEEFCFMIRFLFEIGNRIDIRTADTDYNIDTSSEEQRESLYRMAVKYCEVSPESYCAWREKVLQAIENAERETGNAG